MMLWFPLTHLIICYEKEQLLPGLDLSSVCLLITGFWTIKQDHKAASCPGEWASRNSIQIFQLFELTKLVVFFFFLLFLFPSLPSFSHSCVRNPLVDRHSLIQICQNFDHSYYEYLGQESVKLKLIRSLQIPSDWKTQFRLAQA